MTPSRPAVPWLDSWEEELLLFPNGRHDEQVDTLSYAALEVTQRRRVDGKALARYREHGANPQTPSVPYARLRNAEGARMRWTALLLCLVMTVTSCGGPTDPTVSQSTITAAEMATRYVRLRDAGYPVWSSIDDILQFLRQKGDSVADVDCWHGSVRDEQQHWADFDAVGAERLTEVIAACPEINPELLAEAIEAANPTASQDELATVIRTMLQIAAVD